MNLYFPKGRCPPSILKKCGHPQVTFHCSTAPIEIPVDRLTTQDFDVLIIFRKRIAEIVSNSMSLWLRLHVSHVRFGSLYLDVETEIKL